MSVGESVSCRHKLVVGAAAVLLVCSRSDALGHAERPSFFPEHRLGEVPAYRTSGPSLVVCKSDSRRRIQRRLAGAARRRNLRLLPRCGFHHIQAAVDHARNGYRILLLPGVYLEQPSRRAPNPDPRCADELTTITIPEAVRPQPSYGRSLDPPDRDRPRELPDAEQRRLGHSARVTPEGTLPLVVAWQATAADPAPAQITSPFGSLTTP